MAHSETWTRLGKGDLPTEDMDQGLGHIVPTSIYNYIFLSLVALTLLTVWAATLEVGPIAHLVVAMIIAIIKASLVYGFFMHLMFEKKIIWIIVLYPFIILALMILGTTGDATVKKESLPMNFPVNYDKGKAFGVNDEFLKPGIVKDTAHTNAH